MQSTEKPCFKKWIFRCNTDPVTQILFLYAVKCSYTYFLCIVCHFCGQWLYAVYLPLHALPQSTGRQLNQPGASIQLYWTMFHKNVYIYKPAKMAATQLGPIRARKIVAYMSVGCVVIRLRWFSKYEGKSQYQII